MCTRDGPLHKWGEFGVEGQSIEQEERYLLLRNRRSITCAPQNDPHRAIRGCFWQNVSGTDFKRLAWGQRVHWCYVTLMPHARSQQPLVGPAITAQCCAATTELAGPALVPCSLHWYEQVCQTYQNCWQMLYFIFKYHHQQQRACQFCCSETNVNQAAQWLRMVSAS